MPRGVTQTVAPTGEPLLVSDLKEWLRIPPADTTQDAQIAGLLAVARDYVERNYNRQLCTATWQLSLDRFPRYSSSAVWQYNSDAIWQQRLPITQLSGQWYPDRAAIRVTRPPLQQLLSIVYTDGKGNQQTLTSIIAAGVPGSGPQTVTPSTMVGIVPNLAIVVDVGAAQETVTVSSVTATTFTATFAAGHPANVVLNVVPGASAPLTGGSIVNVDTSTEPARISPAYGQIWPIVRQQLANIQVTFVAGYGAPASLTAPWPGPPQAGLAMKLLVSHWFENREAVGMGVTDKIPLGIDALLMSLWPGEYE